MGVPCSGCGREYDVALFAFGRTIHCTCGSRVGIAPRVRTRAPDVPLRFIADAMLGRLARWLRILGFDTEHEPDIADAELVRRGIAGDRVILTRDRSLPVEWSAPAVHVVAATATHAQLREVVAVFELAPGARLFTRCSRCNAPLVRAAGRDLIGRVPPRILASGVRLRRCPRCERVYWRGSHADRMERVAVQILAEASPAATESRRIR